MSVPEGNKQEMRKAPDIALWLSTPNHLFAEIALACGYKTFVLDIEHGLFDLNATDRLVAYCRLGGADVFAKVRCNGPYDVQQMLDRGCNGVIIPHVDSVVHAQSVTAAAKYPPLGTRSFDGGRCVDFSVAPENYFTNSNAAIQAIPMIETAKGLAEVYEIANLSTVDALLVGPYDLSLSAGRGPYLKTAEDTAALQRISDAAAAAGKTWWMPAWSESERRTAVELGAACLVVEHELGLFKKGLQQLTDELVGL